MEGDWAGGDGDTLRGENGAVAGRGETWAVAGGVALRGETGAVVGGVALGGLASAVI